VVDRGLPGRILKVASRDRGREGGRKQAASFCRDSANRSFALGNQLLFACFLGIAM